VKDRDPSLYLTHVLESIELARAYVRGIDFRQFSESQRLQGAVMCRALGVKRLDRFGSAATDAFRPGSSGVDLVVDFGDMGGRAKARAYFDRDDGLSGLGRCRG